MPQGNQWAPLGMTPEKLANALRKEAKNAENERILKEKKAKPCYDAVVKLGKYTCPECNAVEQETSGKIKHDRNCVYSGKPYCQYISAEKERLPKGCYDAVLNELNKYTCPLCGSVEGGTMRIINHTSDCKNSGISYCQQLPTSAGGKRKTRKTRKTTKHKRRLRRRSYARRK
jgi:hypothetical protein